MCLDKYLRYASIKGMVQKFQIRQLIASRHMGVENNVTARCHKLAVFETSAVTAVGFDLSQVHGATRW